MIATDDIYMAAYLQAKGLSISDIKVSANSGGDKVNFSLTGKNEFEIEASFHAGQAVVNIKDYLYRLFELRNVMYSMKNNRKTLGGHNGKLRRRHNQKAV